jgi:hypothetical protein
MSSQSGLPATFTFRFPPKKTSIAQEANPESPREKSISGKSPEGPPQGGS